MAARLGVQLTVVSDEAAALQGEVGELAAELCALRTQVTALRGELRTTATGGVEESELLHGNQLLDTAATHRLAAVTGGIMQEVVGREEANLREAVRNTMSEGLLLEKQLRSLQGREGAAPPAAVEQETAPGLRDVRRAAEEQGRLGERRRGVTRLVGGNTDALQQTVAEVQAALHRLARAEAALAVKSEDKIKSEEVVDLTKFKEEDMKTQDIYSQEQAICDTLKQETGKVDKDVRQKMESVVKVMAGLKEVVTADMEGVLVRVEVGIVIAH